MTMKKLMMIATMMFGSAAMAKGYGDAGCGLGSMVMGAQPGFSQVFAGTTNGTSGSQTFGITSGTSNCVDGGAVSMEMRVPHYLEVNRFALAKEAARGGGETVSGLASIMGCDSAKLGRALQKNYDDVFVKTNMEASAMEKTITGGIKADACGA
jgi:hypothetical protein